MRISVIIPFKDDHYLLKPVLDAIGDEVDEIIIVDDGSQQKLELAQQDKLGIIRNDTTKGVGYSFDQGVLAAHGDVLLLMGADVLLKDRKWLKQAVLLSKQYPKSIICATCVGIREPTHDWVGRTRRYGADLLFKVTKADLSATSPYQEHEEYFDILQSKWRWGKEQDTPYEVPCVLGAAYIISKAWYMYIGGWGYIKPLDGLTREEKKFCGFKSWGGLEPMISLKSWFAGGSCMVAPQWETAHMFGRGEHATRVRGKRWDDYYFNKLFIAYTLFPEDQAKILDEHLLKWSTQNKARLMIKRNWNAIMLEKQFNDYIKENDIYLFKERFNYAVDWLKK